MKVRVKQIDDKFYPQFQRFGIWYHFTRLVCAEGPTERIVFNDFDIAEIWTLQELERKSKKAKVKIHEIDLNRPTTPKPESLTSKDPNEFYI